MCVRPCDCLSRHYLRIVLAASRLRWALLLARMPLHHAWMAIATRNKSQIRKNIFLMWNVECWMCLFLTCSPEFLVFWPLAVTFPSCLQFGGCKFTTKRETSQIFGGDANLYKSQQVFRRSHQDCVSWSQGHPRWQTRSLGNGWRF